MSQNFRHETNTFTLPTTGTPVTVLTFNPSSLQYARVQISGGTALWIGDGVGGDGLPLQNGVAVTFTGGEYRGDSDEVTVKLCSADGAEITVDVMKCTYSRRMI
ncbi:MAG: hypothetical protein PHR14_08850 [Oscillospiraceae bacterium]|nr:hypothetical protein [Oscillospiraceae bacterium]